jgi:PAS domain S-box-containing protein
MSRLRDRRVAQGLSGDSVDLFRAVAVGVCLLDEDGRSAAVNPAAEALLGWSTAQVAGIPAHDVLHRGVESTAQCPLSDAGRTGTVTERDTDLFRRADGSLLPVWWVAAPVYPGDPAQAHGSAGAGVRGRFGGTGSGTPAGAAIVFGDVTGRQAQAVSDEAVRAQDRAELAAARQLVARLRWMADTTHLLSSTLDERQALQRLATTTARHLAQVSVVSVADDHDGLQLVGGALADGVSLDLATLLAQPASALAGTRAEVTRSTIRAGQVSLLTEAEWSDQAVLDDASRAMLAAAGAEQVLVVPLVGRAHLLGVLALIRTAGQPAYTDSELLLAEDLSRRAGLALDNIRLYRAQLDTAATLQRALLPTLPTTGPVQAAARYLPARSALDVGGDWYDMFALPLTGAPQATALVIGDVAGHDLRAAASMAAIRNLLRGIAVTSPANPAQTLTTVDRNLTNLGISGTASALLMTAAHLPDGAWSVTWSSAGHLPPLLLTTTGPPRFLDDLHGPILGTGQQRLPRRHSTITVPADSTLVLYTDGLIETRRHPLDDSLARLRRTAQDLDSRADPNDIADQLLSRQHPSPEDDTALLACHLPG